MNQRGEASVEEILDSIKKVIARDNRESSMAERKRRAAESSASDEINGDEVFDLAQAEMVGGPDFGIEHDDEPNDDDAPLVAAPTRSSMQENFAALAMLAEPGAQPQIVRSGETSLEGLVREMLRPLLAEWLDKNLPETVERLVKAEIERIARKRG